MHIFGNDCKDLKPCMCTGQALFRNSFHVKCSPHQSPALGQRRSPRTLLQRFYFIILNWFFVQCALIVFTPHPTLVPVSSSIKPSLYWLHILGYVAIHWSVVNIAGATLFKNHLFLSQQQSAANSCSSKVELRTLLSILVGLV